MRRDPSESTASWTDTFTSVESPPPSSSLRNRFSRFGRDTSHKSRERSRERPRSASPPHVSTSAATSTPVQGSTTASAFHASRQARQFSATPGGRFMHARRNHAQPGGPSSAAPSGVAPGQRGPHHPLRVAVGGTASSAAAAPASAGGDEASSVASSAATVVVSGGDGTQVGESKELPPTPPVRRGFRAFKRMFFSPRSSKSSASGSRDKSNASGRGAGAASGPENSYSAAPHAGAVAANHSAASVHPRRATGGDVQFSAAAVSDTA